MENVDELKKATEIEYKKIISVYSPALKAEVIFNSDGFHHLRYDNSRAERSKTVQKNKFLFLNKAVTVIKTSTTVQEYRRSICPIGKTDKKGFRKTSTVEWFGLLAIVSFTKSIRIMVIVRRIGGENGNYHFWSVMPRWSLTNDKRHIIGTKEIEDN